MDIEGNLEAMNLPTLVQFIAQDGGRALIQLEHDTKIGQVYLDGGQLRHAELQGPHNNNLSGEEAVYELLHWHSGRFKVTKGILPPEITIQQNWDFLLMEGLRRIDESQANELDELVEEESLANILENLSEADAAIIKGMVAPKKDEIDMADINTTLEGIMKMDGAIAAAVVDYDSGLTLGTIGTGLNIELAAAGNTNVVRAKMGVMKDLKLKGSIEDMLITLSEQYHLIRMLHGQKSLFIYVALDRSRANLGLARHQLSQLESDLDF